MFNETIFGIGISKFNLTGIDNERICEEVKYYSTNPNNNPISKRSIKNNNQYFSKLNKVVLEQSQNILSGITSNPNLKAIFKRMWGNHNLNDDICHPHTHRDSFLSAVYYPKSTDGRLQFYCPWMDSMLAHISVHNITESFNQYNSTHYEVVVKTGDLVIFPAMLPHMVIPTNNERFSVAYDIGVKNGSI